MFKTDAYVHCKALSEISLDTAGNHIDQRYLLIGTLISSGDGLGQYLSGYLPEVEILTCFNSLE